MSHFHVAARVFRLHSSVQSCSGSRRLGERAALILRNAASRAKLGGRVVFVVCSVLRAECEEVAESVRDVLEPAPFDAPEAVSLLGAHATECRLLPNVHGTDGYYVASFVRRA